MPGYYDWKIRNCGLGAIANAERMMQTMDMVDAYCLDKLWSEGGGSFTTDVNAKLHDIVEDIDAAEDALAKAQAKLAAFLPGGPSAPVAE